MKNKKILKQILAGILVPSVLLTSCNSPYFFDETDVVSINNQLAPCARSSIAVPINLNLNSEDLKFLKFLDKLSKDIMENPLIAKQLAEDPQAIAKAYGVQDMKINFDDELWKLIITLGDEDLHKAVKAQDISLFFSLCEDRGLISELKESDIVKYINESVYQSEEVEAESGVLAAGVVVFVLAIGGNAVVGATAALIYDTYAFWDGTESISSSSMKQRDLQAYQLWVLKNGKENTHIMLTEYQEKIVNDCIDALQKYYPEEAGKIDIVELRQLITLNMPK
ncbi:MAG: hypothetical protein LBL90_11845 [Prevotellaceae bacterium]|jgi:hypothetical protein|nr:hypothetical protein [Prevotellaceae bacterium]